MEPIMASKMIVVLLLSGGMDSTIAACAFKEKYYPDAELHAVTFRYGQRNDTEVAAALAIGTKLGVVSHEVIDLGLALLKSDSALTNTEKPLPVVREVLPIEGWEPLVIPGRNALFLTIAANRAFALDPSGICLVTGFRDGDQYPDANGKFTNRMAEALSEGFFGKEAEWKGAGSEEGVEEQETLVKIINPLTGLHKSDAIIMAATFSGCMELLALTQSCPSGQFPPVPHTPQSILRAQAFYEAGFSDPVIVRAKRAGSLPAEYPDTGLVIGTEWEPKVKEFLEEPPELLAEGEQTIGQSIAAAEEAKGA